MDTILAAAAFCVSVVTFAYCRYFIKKRTSDERILGELRQEVQDIVNEIDRATDRDSQLVEARVKHLQTVIEEADRKISGMGKSLDTYNREILARNKERSLLDRMTVAVPSVSPPTPPAPAAQPVSAAPVLPSAPRPTRQPEPEPDLPLPERAAGLAMQGNDVTAIAQKLNISEDEARFALAMAGA
jgi:hypothetical protein